MEEITLGKRIMMLRKQKGLTQEQLAQSAGVTAQAVSKWENDVSCPDITLLPQIAEILGVSTDELLGVKPVEPRVVVLDTNKTGDTSDRKKNWNIDIDVGNGNGLYFGIMVILVGLVFLLDRLHVLPLGEISLWGIVWPAVMIGLGVSWTIRHRSVFALAIALLGLYYLLFNLNVVMFTLSWGVIWPVLLILLGLSIVMEKAFKKKGHGWHVDGSDHRAKSEYSDDNNYVKMEAAFCEDNRSVNLEEFCGGDVDMSFGKGTLDLTKVKRVASGAVLDVDVSFGEYDILLPAHIRTALDVDKAFGSINVTGSPSQDATQMLRIKGDASFGTVVIKYV